MSTDEDHGEFGDQVARSGVRGFSGARLRRYRDGRGLTMDDLAAAAAVSPQAISAWETGRSAPTPHLLHRVVGILHITVADLVPIPQQRWRLQDLRVQAGMTQTAAAAALGISPTQLGRYEKGRELSAAVSRAMAAVYGVPEATVAKTGERTVDDREQAATRLRNS